MHEFSILDKVMEISGDFYSSEGVMIGIIFLLLIFSHDFSEVYILRLERIFDLVEQISEVIISYWKFVQDPIHLE